MEMTFAHLNPMYRRKLVERWKSVIDVEGAPEIKDTQLRENMAMAIQNTHQFLNPVTEAYSAASGAWGAGDSTADGGGALGSSFSVTGGPNDYRMPHIVMPLLRRTFPALLAHNLVGVQPMNGPVGLAFAMRYKYDKYGKGYKVSTGDELGYNVIDAAFTGATGTISDEADWQAFAGTGNPGVGQAANMEDAEWWGLEADMPTAKLGIEKAAIIAKSRKFGTSYSLEAAEDMMHTQGIDIDSEMVSVLGQEIKNELDRELLEAMVKLCIGASDLAADEDSKSVWDPTTADGRHQLERIATLYTHILQRRQKVAVRTHDGAANWCVASPDVTALLERLSDFGTQDMQGGGNTTSTDGAAETTFIGTLRSGSIKCYRDIFAGGNYALLGYKGQRPTQTGVVYCPYIPVEIARATGENTFNPRLAVRTRYGIHNNMFGSSKYYQFVRIDNLTAAALAADGSRYFTS